MHKILKLVPLLPPNPSFRDLQTNWNPPEIPRVQGCLVAAPCWDCPGTRRQWWVSKQTIYIMQLIIRVHKSKLGSFQWKRAYFLWMLILHEVWMIINVIHKEILRKYCISRVKRSQLWHWILTVPHLIYQWSLKFTSKVRNNSGICRLRKRYKHFNLLPCHCQFTWYSLW